MYKVSFWSQKYILLKVVGLKDLTYYVIDCRDCGSYIITWVSNCLKSKMRVYHELKGIIDHTYID